MANYSSQFVAQWCPMTTGIKKKPQLPDIPEGEQTSIVKGLLALLEQFAVRIQEQDEEIARLKDEVSLLKGERKRPKFKGSKLDSETDREAEADADSSGTPRKRAGSRKKAKTSQLTIHEEKTLAPAGPVPEGSIFKGYRDFFVQDLVIQAHNTRYRQERWITPAGDTLVGALPSSLRNRHFGPQLVSYILYQHHHCQTTQPLLLEQLREWGIDISSGQINQLLVCGQKAFHEEKDDLLQVGLDVSSYVTVDDSGARHQGRNGYVTQIGNDFFAWFCSTNSKSRVNFLELLRAGQQDYVLTEAALSYMQKQKLPKAPLAQLRQRIGECIANKHAWRTLLKALAITSTRHCRIATEGALLGSVLHHGLCDDLAIVSDDAGQFNVLSHGLCWVHAERLIHKLLPLNEAHREDITRVRGEIWDLYADLKSYKHQPDIAQREALSQRFEVVFTQQTRYASLNRTLKGIHSNKAELLLVLERPEIPLHTNGSETDIRDYVKKRKVSGGTRSDEGRRCRDTFASLKKTCRKLDISFWQYIRDRLGIGETTIHRLPDIVRERAAAPAY
jgi:hypothetical protein